MKFDRILNKPFLLFLPFLALFIIIVLKIPTTGHAADEERYLYFGDNLLHGFFSPPPPATYLPNGPGFPIFLVPFLALRLPLIAITLFNALFQYLSIIVLYKALKRIVNLKLALIFSFAWALYYISYQNLALIHTESISYLLITLIIYSLIRIFKGVTSSEVRKYSIIAGLALGYLALTKILFGYIILVMLGGSLLMWLIYRHSKDIPKAIIMLSIAFATTLPYLIYTYHITGRMFYWGSGGDTLYWMSTPFKNEYGDWKNEFSQGTADMANYNIPGSVDTLKAHYSKDFAALAKLKGVEQDDYYKKVALNNIKNHPLKYLENLIYNIGRLVFHYPFSYAVQRPKVLFVIPLNGIVFTLMLFALIPTLINFRRIPPELKFLLLTTLVYLGASSVVSAFVRYFTVIVPILFIWFAYIFDKTVKIKLKLDN